MAELAKPQPMPGTLGLRKLSHQPPPRQIGKLFFGWALFTRCCVPNYLTEIVPEWMSGSSGKE